VRLISSDLALAEVLALSAAEELRLSDVARATASKPSAAQRALEILVDDGVVERAGANRVAYRLKANELASDVFALAVAAQGFDRSVAIGARANSAIEFAAVDAETLVVVFSAQSTALEQSRAARYLEAVAARHSTGVRYLDHDDVRRDLLNEPQLRRRMARKKILHGELDRTFPDRRGYGMRQGKPLHRPHRSLRIPSRNALRAIARRHHLDSLKLFGSAVRTDFRPDSDVDVLFKYRRGDQASWRAEIELERKLESMFGRDVDLVREENLLPEVRQRIDLEAVPLL
jgi:uncharacterized protein